MRKRMQARKPLRDLKVPGAIHRGYFAWNRCVSFAFVHIVCPVGLTINAMEPVQNGESSRSPARRSTSPRRLLQAEHSHGAAGSTGGGDAQGQGQEADRSETQLGADGIAKSRLILPEWDSKSTPPRS